MSNYRCCSLCKNKKPLTAEYYHRNNKNSSGYAYQCKVCHNRHRSAAWKDRIYHHIKRQCLGCGNEFIASYAQLNKGWDKYCTSYCFNLYMKKKVSYNNNLYLKDCFDYEKEICQ